MDHRKEVRALLEPEPKQVAIEHLLKSKFTAVHQQLEYNPMVKLSKPNQLNLNLEVQLEVRKLMLSQLLRDSDRN
jgi:hypothetical protein